MEASEEVSSGADVAGDPLAPAGNPFARMGKEEAMFHGLWKDNWLLEFSSILHSIRRRPGRLYISVDLEFCGAADVDPQYWPQDPDDWYNYVTRFVHSGDVLQMGLALAFEQPASARAEPVVAWDVNFRFDASSRNYHPDTLAFFLTGEAKHNLADHWDKGVLPEWVCSALLRHLPLGDPTVTWITFHGDKDIMFLLQLMQRDGHGLLPLERGDFIQLLKEKFPCFYDVKVLAQLVKPGYKDGLQKLAEILKVTRIGQSHHASSDAVLAMACFSDLIKRYTGVQDSMLRRQGLLSGLEQIHPAIRNALFIGDTRMPTVVQVRPSNFDAEARRIAELIPANFNIVFLVVRLPGLPTLSFSANAQEEYQLLQCSLRERATDAAEVVIGFTNADGLVGWGCLWSFRLVLTHAKDMDYPAKQRMCKHTNSGLC